VAVRGFNGFDDHIDLAMGSVPPLGGPLTVLFLVRMATNEEQFLILVRDSDTGDAWWVNTGGDGNLYFATGGFTSTPFNSSDGWVIIGFSKATGSATVRAHKYVLSTDTWTHSNLGSIGDSFGLTPDLVRIGNQSANSGALNGNLALAAVWDSVLSDGDIEDLTSLGAWRAADPAGLWLFTQESTDDPVEDLTGNGADQVAIGGTTVVTDDDPPGFDFSLEVAHTATVNDTAMAADTPTSALDMVRSVTDDAVAADDVDGQLIQAHSRTVSDDAVAADEAVPLLFLLHSRTVSDDAVAGDEVATQVAFGYSRTVSDDTGITDLGEQLRLAVADTLTDDAGVDDTTTPAVQLARTITDTAVGVDAAATDHGGLTAVTIDDTAGLADATAVALNEVGVPWAPSLSHVAAYVPARTLARDSETHELTFNSETLPTGVQVQQLVVDAVAWVQARTGPTIDVSLYDQAKACAAIWAAAAVERGFPDEEDESLRRAKDLQALVEQMREDLARANEAISGVDPTDPADLVLPLWSMPDPVPWGDTLVL
jgi:hypothetical protein